MAKEVKSFLRLAGYYKHFVEGFTKLAQPFIKLTHMDFTFRWSNSCKQSFQELKKRLTSAPILALLVEGEEYNLYTNPLH